MNPHIENAEDRLAAVLALHDEVRAIYSSPEPRTEPAKRQRSRQVAGLHEGIRFGLKAAEVHALLAIATAVHDQPQVDDGPCGDLSPALKLGDRDLGRGTCVLRYGHPSPVHIADDGSSWREGVDDDPMPDGIPDRALAVIARARADVDAAADLS